MTRDAQDILGAILKDGADVHRCAAAQALGQLSLPEATSQLTPALLDEDPDVRADAAEALRLLGDPATAGALMQNLLGDPEPDVKKPALAALIAMRHAAIIPLLRQLAVSRTEEIIWDDDEFYADEWDSWIDLQAMAIEGLGAFGDEDAVVPVLTAMGDELGQDVTIIGIAALSKMGAPGVAALADLFDGGSEQMRRRIAEAVAAGHTATDIPLIDALLADPCARVREVALTALDPDDARLIPLFQDEAAPVRAAVIAHAGAASPAIAAALVEDDDAAVRAEVFRIVAAHPDLFPEEELSDTIQKSISGDPKAAIQAAFALLALRGKSAVKGLTHAMVNDRPPLEFRLGAIEVLKAAGPVSVPYLLRAAGDPDRQMRLAALTGVVGFAADDPVWPNAAGDGLLSALNGELVLPPEEDAEDEALTEDLTEAGDQDVADIAPPLTPVQEVKPPAPSGSTLDSILSPTPPPTDPEPQEAQPIELDSEQQRMLDLAQSNRMSKRKMALQVEVAPHLDVRRFAATLLGGVPNIQVTRRLLDILAEEDGELREAALASLVQHGEITGQLPAEALSILRAVLSEKASEIRVLALRAMAWVPDETAADLLTEHLSDADPQMRVEAVRGRGLRGIDDELTDACLSDPYVGVGFAAARIMAEQRGADAVDALITFACSHDGTHRREIGQLLGLHAGQPAIDRLQDLLSDDTRQRERLVLIEALAAAIAQSTTQENRKVA